jgi:hypothetical protein
MGMEIPDLGLVLDGAAYILFGSTQLIVKFNSFQIRLEIIGVQVRWPTMGRPVPQALVQRYADAFAEQQRLKEVSGLRLRTSGITFFPQ